jgi:hypothetical protein
VSSVVAELTRRWKRLKRATNEDTHFRFGCFVSRVLLNTKDDCLEAEMVQTREEQFRRSCPSEHKLNDRFHKFSNKICLLCDTAHVIDLNYVNLL